MIPLDTMMAFGNSRAMTPTELKRIRKELGLTQERLGERLGVTQNTVARWEISRRRIPEPTARLIGLLLAEARKSKRRK